MKYTLPVILVSILMILVTGCTLLSSPPPIPSATVGSPEATALDALPPTWTAAPTLTPSPTDPPTPTVPPPTATANLDNFDIAAMMTPVGATHSPVQPSTATWNLIQGQTASLLVPPSYKVVDLGEEFGAMMEALVEGFVDAFSEFSEDLTEAMEITPEATGEIPELENFPEMEFLLALDEADSTAIVLTSEVRTPGLSTEKIINETLTGLDGDFTLITREMIENADRPTERVILDVDNPEMGPERNLIYGMVGEEHAWILILSSPREAFQTNLPIFEAVASSLTPLK